MPGRPRRIGLDKYHTEDLTSEEIHKLLVKTLGAKLVPDDDETVPAEWAKPKLTQKEMEDMGLFDEYAKAGIDLGEIDLTPFRYDDGIYTMAFVGADFQEAKKREWGHQIETRFMFIGDAEGNKNKYTGKSHTMWLSLPLVSSTKSDDDDIKKKALGALNRTFQTLYALGIEEPQKMNLEDLAPLKGERYIVKLNTPAENNPNSTQFTNVLKRLGENSPTSVSSGPNPFDQE